MNSIRVPSIDGGIWGVLGGIRGMCQYSPIACLHYLFFYILLEQIVKTCTSIAYRDTLNTHLYPPKELSGFGQLGKALKRRHPAGGKVCSPRRLIRDSNNYPARHSRPAHHHRTTTLGKSPVARPNSEGMMKKLLSILIAAAALISAADAKECDRVVDESKVAKLCPDPNAKCLARDNPGFYKESDPAFYKRITRCKRRK